MKNLLLLVLVAVFACGVCYGEEPFKWALYGQFVRETSKDGNSTYGIAERDGVSFQIVFPDKIKILPEAVSVANQIPWIKKTLVAVFYNPEKDAVISISSCKYPFQTHEQWRNFLISGDSNIIVFPQETEFKTEKTFAWRLKSDENILTIFVVRKDSLIMLEISSSKPFLRASEHLLTNYIFIAKSIKFIEYDQPQSNKNPTRSYAAFLYFLKNCQKKDNSDALDALSESVSLKYPDAQMFLGMIFENSKDIKRRYFSALLFMESASSGKIESIFELMKLNINNDQALRDMEISEKQILETTKQLIEDAEKNFVASIELCKFATESWGKYSGDTTSFPENKSVATEGNINKNQRIDEAPQANIASPLLRPTTTIIDKPLPLLTETSPSWGPSEYDFPIEKRKRPIIEETSYYPDYSSTYSSGTLRIKPNAYGLGVNSDQYGRATRYEVIGSPKENTDLLKVKQNTFGPGIGSDQYGRPVKNVPAY